MTKHLQVTMPLAKSWVVSIGVAGWVGEVLWLQNVKVKQFSQYNKLKIKIPFGQTDRCFPISVNPPAWNSSSSPGESLADPSHPGYHGLMSLHWDRAKLCCHFSGYFLASLVKNSKIIILTGQTIPIKLEKKVKLTSYLNGWYNIVLKIIVCTIWPLSYSSRGYFIESTVHWLKIQ